MRQKDGVSRRQFEKREERQKKEILKWEKKKGWRLEETGKGGRVSYVSE